MSDQDSQPKSTLTDRFNRVARMPYAGLPEMQLFPDERSRDEALKSIEGGMTPRTVRDLIGFLVLCFVLLAVPYVVVSTLLKVVAPGYAHGTTVSFAAAIVLYTVLVYVLIRRDIPRELRKKLLKCGVPVCLKCGYWLKGLPSDRRLCPECGKPIGAKSRSLLKAHSMTQPE